MKRWEIYKDGKHFMETVGSKDSIEKICQKNGWTFDYMGEEAESANTLVIASPELVDKKINAVDQRLDFIEDCMAEMAMIVYKEDE